jgi:hypothetical protein
LVVPGLAHISQVEVAVLVDIEPFPTKKKTQMLLTQ